MTSYCLPAWKSVLPATIAYMTESMSVLTLLMLLAVAMLVMIESYCLGQRDLAIGRFAAEIEPARVPIDAIPDAFAGDDLIFDEETG
jgi:hypothetical protein